MTDPKNDAHDLEMQADGQRKQYSPPKLIEYGSIEELTQTGFGFDDDGGVGASSFPTM